MMFQKAVATTIAAVLLGSGSGTTLASVAEEECGLYLAISSTSTAEETNWGLYAGQDIPSDSLIGSPDVGILLPYLRAHNSRDHNEDDDEEENEEQQQLQNSMSVVDFFEGFFWVAETAGAKFELPPDKTGSKQQQLVAAIAAVPGAGVLASYKTKMTNADWNNTSTYFRLPHDKETGRNHPNRGANSPYYNVQVQSTQDIPRGQEIFMEFGETWAEEEGKEELDTKDFDRIDETVQQMIDFFARHKDELDEDGKTEIYGFLTRDVMKAAVGQAKARRVSAILPPHPDDLHKVLDAGGSLKYSDPTAFRTTEWLQTYGLCMDHIRAGPSIIPNAGEGAFATRNISKGKMVAPAPLTHIPEKSVLDMHELKTNEDNERVRASDDVIGHQMLLNYCYGHPESSMVFYPAGAVASVINHSDKPNAKLSWSKHAAHQKLWLQMEPQELLDEEYMYIGLVMEVVALRDIQEGEEIFIDYGPEWKAAYEKYVAEWNGQVSSGAISKEWPLRAVDVNAKYRDQPFKTPDQLAKEPYPDNVRLMAFLLLQDTSNMGTREDPKLWGESENETAFHHDNVFDVTVVERDADSNTYTVLWRNDMQAPTFVKGVPHDALVFVDQPGTSDQFVEKPFRHYIGIPDDVFPQGPWRNLK